MNARILTVSFKQTLKLLLAVAAMLAVGARQEAAASMMFGTTGNGSTISTLVRLDPTTGGLLGAVGSVGYTVNGLSFDPTSGKLYGSTSIGSPGWHGLIEINLTTGAGTPIGNAFDWGLNDGGYAGVHAITVNSSGQMYGWWDPGQDDLVSINKTTGIATRVGESGVGTAVNGLAFDNSGTLYMVNYGGDYYTINTVTGAATYAGYLGSTAHHGSFNPDNNLYYGIDTASSYYSPRNLIVADLGSATYTTLPTIDYLHTVAFAPVPEPSTYLAGALLMLPFAIQGIRNLHHRKPAA